MAGLQLPPLSSLPPIPSDALAGITPAQIASLTPEGLANIEYQFAHPSDNRGPEALAVNVVLFSLAALAVFFRFQARRFASVQLAKDDYLIGLCLFIALGNLINTSIMFKKGLGRHAIIIGIPETRSFLINSYVTQIIYALQFPLTKVSVLMFYHRVFPIHRVRVFLWVLGTLMVMWFTGAFFAALFTCNPISYFWDRAIGGAGTCFDTEVYYNFNGGLNVFTDLILLLLPVPIVLKLKMRRGEKFGILFIFLIGVVTTIASIVRLKYMWVLVGTTTDPTWDGVNLMNWTNVECCFGIICACLPSLRSLFMQRFGFSSGGYSDSHSSRWSKLKISWPSHPNGDSFDMTAFQSDPTLLNQEIMTPHSRSFSLSHSQSMSPLLKQDEKFGMRDIEPIYDRNQYRTTWQDIEKGLPLRRVSIELDLPFLRGYR
ncbi:MAG: hypothetical protein M1838_006161 [Thelocarpon superellum]|nr:MAG: hypothetical protein M1838_006161 [Thelocarpon superellum]